MNFRPFTYKDFDAYLPNKWQSNVFNRERLEVKEKLLALGRLLSPALTSTDGSPLECEVSAEHPALWNQHRVQDQHLFFSRNRESRGELEGIITKQRSMAALIEDPSPLRNHIFLAVRIDHQELELALKLHSDAAVDRENLQRKSQEYFARERLLGLVHGLPGGFQVGLQGKTMVPTAELDDEALLALVGDLPGAGTWLSLAYNLPRDDEQARSEALVDLAKERLAALLPLMHYMSWHRENDFVSIRKTLKKVEDKKKTRGLKKQDRIRVVKGMFTGKVGIVEEVDAKGTLKVRMGQLPVTLDPAEVIKV